MSKKNFSFADIHCHVLHKLDDGPQSLADSHELMNALEKDGVEYVIATPHVHPGAYPFNRERYDSSLRKAQEYCHEKNFRLKVLPGAEIRYSDALVRHLQNDDLPSMNDTNMLLIEWRTDTTAEQFFKGVREITNLGYTVIVAHIERYRSLWSKIEKIEELRESCRLQIQIDGEALLDRGPFFMKRFVRVMLKRGMIDYVASDAHDTDKRKPIMSETYKYLEKHYGEECAEKLVYRNAYNRLIG